MQKGTIAKVTENGFGFILPEGEEKDIFFHANEVKDGMFNALKEGDVVTFETAEGKKGLNAVNVEKVGDAPAAQAPAEMPEADAAEESAE